ncbi:MAG TPA: hypothetical protein DCO72_01615 [Ruminococcus sp.]|nr:hypothetical protein [Ruminococcus sp.]
MKYLIEVTSRPDCCEVGAFGIHFAYGKGETDSLRAVHWFEEHEGYTVTEKSIEGGSDASDGLTEVSAKKGSKK